MTAVVADRLRYRLGDWLFEPELDRLSRGATLHRLEPRLTGVLLHLAANPRRVCRREELIDTVWKDAVVGEEVLTRAISELRRLLGDDPHDPRYVETIRSRGYRLLVSPVPIDADHEPSDALSGEGAARGFVLSRWIRPLPGALIVAVVVAVSGWLLLARGDARGPAQPSPEGHLAPAVPLTSLVGEESYPALSPGGDLVAFGWTGPQGENTDVYVKEVHGESLLRLTDDPGADTYPAWSPDGGRITYIHGDESGQSIYSVPVIGGAPELLVADRGSLWGQSWAPDGRHLVYSARLSREGPFGLYVRDTVAGTDRQLTRPPSGFRGDVFPVVSPDGTRVAFIRADEASLDELYLVSWRDGEETALTHGALFIEGLDWTPDGDSIVFGGVSSASYQLYSIDVATSKMVGISTRAEHVWSPTFSRRTGRLAYRSVNLKGDIWRIERAPGEQEAGKQSLIASTRWDSEASYSPDASRIAFISARSGHLELWVAEADGARPLQLTSFSGISLGRPQWSPDGERIAFHARPDGVSDLFVVPSHGGRVRRLTADGTDHLLSSWSRDGRWLYFGARTDGRWQLFRLQLDDPGAPPERVTRSGGIRGFETADGSGLLLTRPAQPGLWRLELTRDFADQEPSLVFADLPELVDWGNWAVADSGVVMAQYDDEGNATLVWLDLATLELETICPIPGMARPGLSVSPDGLSILYGRVDRRDSDLMLVEQAPRVLVP